MAAIKRPVSGEGRRSHFLWSSLPRTVGATRYLVGLLGVRDLEVPELPIEIVTARRLRHSRGSVWTSSSLWIDPAFRPNVSPPQRPRIGRTQYVGNGRYLSWP